MAHTPGPWTTEKTRDFGASYRVMDEGECTVALCYQQPLDSWHARDNARLIAAAPDLLEACTELFLQMRREGGGHQAQLERALAAIRKATGDQP